MKMRTLLATACCTVAFAAAGTVIASAATHDPDESTWMACPGGKPVTTGHLDTLTVVGSETVGPPPGNEVRGPTITYGIIDIAGTVAACHQVPATGGPGFAVGTYGDGNRISVADGSYVRYSEEGAGGTFATRMYVIKGRAAVCLLTDPNTRLNCYRLSWSGGTPTVGDPLPTGDPLVARECGLHNYNREPNCPTCIN